MSATFGSAAPEQDAPRQGASEQDAPEIPYTVRRSTRARHARVNVSPDGVEVVVPRTMALRHVPPLVAEKLPWIERTLRRYRAAERTAPRVRLEDGGIVPYLGRELRLEISVEPGRVRPHVRMLSHANPQSIRTDDDPARAAFDRQAEEPANDVLAVALGAPGREPLRAALEGWYRRRAHAEIALRLEEAATRAGAHFTRLTIRGQRTRWASCSSTGAMSFNWRLLLAPEEILLYVVEHEVAHLDVPDHSPRFWNLLAERCPDLRRHERWLRANGPALRL